MIYNIVIFDDDKTQCDIIEKMVGEYKPDLMKHIVIISERNELDRYMEFRNRMDILVTDICIGEDEETGIDVVKRLQAVSPDTQIIYITGYVEYCEEVYETNHISFIRKPISRERLKAALDKAVQNIYENDSRVHRITNGHSIINVKPGSILYIESIKRKLVYTCTDNTIEVYGKLSEVQQRLGNGFVRCHKSFLVNIEHIRELHDNNILLDNGREIAVSRGCYADTRRTLLNYSL